MTTYSYDGLGRLKSETEAGAADARGYAYTYDPRGNRETLTATGCEVYTVGYQYDLNDRLLESVKAAGPVAETDTFRYDPNGNTISRMSEALSPAGAGPAALSLDGTGWEINEYDGFNQLTKSNRDGHVVSYGYRPDGLRLSKAEASSITTHVWDGGSVVAEVNGFTVMRTYLRGANLICAQAAGAREYFGFNAHGDVVQLTDASGNVTKAYRYDAFGNEHDPGANDGNPWRYCGEYLDFETGTYYLPSVA